MRADDSANLERVGIRCRDVSGSRFARVGEKLFVFGKVQGFDGVRRRRYSALKSSVSVSAERVAAAPVHL